MGWIASVVFVLIVIFSGSMALLTGNPWWSSLSVTIAFILGFSSGIEAYPKWHAEVVPRWKNLFQMK